MSSANQNKLITGYNHNIMHSGRVYHIQTEDSGTKYSHIITHLFVGGNIIGSKKSSYADLLEQELDEEGLEKEVRKSMQKQHKEMLKDLKAGKFDHIGERKSGAGELLTPGLIETDDVSELTDLPEPPRSSDVSLSPQELERRDTLPGISAFVPEVPPPPVFDDLGLPELEAPPELPEIPDLQSLDDDDNTDSSVAASRNTPARPTFRAPRPPKPRLPGPEGGEAENSKTDKQPAFSTKTPRTTGGRAFSERRSRPMLELRKPPSSKPPARTSSTGNHSILRHMVTEVLSAPYVPSSHPEQSVSTNPWPSSNIATLPSPQISTDEHSR